VTARVDLAAGYQFELDEEALKVMREITDNVENGAVQIVPIDSGDLRDSIVGEVDNPEPGLVMGRVSAGDPDIGRTMDYAEVVENGRDDMPNYPKQPYLKPALYQYQAAPL
jgi:hypothetical protein